MTTYCHLSFNWDNPTVGSGPFKTGFDYAVPGGSGDQEDVADAVRTWWTSGATTFKGYISVDVGVGSLTSIGDFSGSVIEYNAGSLVAPSGVAPDLPGCSLRAIKVASRPAGGRKGSMYWPLLEGSAYDGDGTIGSTPRTDLLAGLEAMRAAVEGAVTGAVIVQKHVVSGAETYSQVTGFDIAGSVSYLNRRYR